jgi:hypothetical protein
MTMSYKDIFTFITLELTDTALLLVRGASTEADHKNDRFVSLEKTANTKIIDCENVLTTSKLIYFYA